MEELDDTVKAIAAASSPDALEAIRIGVLGRRGSLTLAMRELAALDPDKRRRVGAELNTVKERLTAALAEATVRLGRAELAERLAGERADVTLPVAFSGTGRIHPISQTIDEIVAIFGEMGFAVAEGPHIEEDFYNFTALNIPPEHPARQEHDTFYLTERPDGTRLVLRTHTSPVQIRALLAQGAPIAVIAPGRVYRNDHDMTHSPMFHQLEGLVVGENVSFGNMKAALHGFLQAFFERDLAMRLRPSFFPFTEPSAEVDMSCVFCDGRGCRTCKQTGWLEISGCGMVHPNVLRASGVDPERYTGYAFGAGIDRLAMLRYGVNDLRLFFENDLRFLRQFRTFGA